MFAHVAYTSRGVSFGLLKYTIRPDKPYNSALQINLEAVNLP